jgi:uncharacterized membrane protein YdcZ (DUF606 family)
MLAGLIVWLCGVLHIPQPPADVAGTIGAILLAGGHYAMNWVNAARMPAKAVPASISPPAA